ncbi:hypothetical protein ASPACDRAFT_1890257 [Aspergillus aculeatus ATCC 16872]|uniref:Acetamidase n=1 Tax=Aspergillus aculeatus (strain ATCC 16872 / CBS 172.66 / WB 5094) TaxID=690307 RepID=A0A1L9WNF6_ASPA1|nr:uncharacterized protein ASPACDRAFT_1890257 [Aspergillus aculeatus ATCC 16872]OJJ97712.1 hypothetical protein ASPACDRAFT_1890257 [Aspergillus aculeatus ATCC 16872]
MPDSEVLIHISAPGTVRDDARYRAQVEAILAFQASTRQVITLRSDNDHTDEVNTADSAQLAASSAAVGSTANVNSGEADDDNRELNTGSLHILHRQPETIPVLAGVFSPGQRTQHVADSLGTPISVVPDSQPEQTQQDILALQEINSPVTATVRAHRSSPPITDVPPAKRTRVSPPGIPEKQGDDEPLPGSQNKPSYNQPWHEHAQSTPSVPNLSSALDTPCHDTPSTKNALVTTPLKIHPPLPPVSRLPFKTHITPTLAMLATRLRSGRTYTPVKQTRDLDPLERGYWFLHLTLVPSESSPSPTAPDGNSVSTNTSTTWDVSFFTRFWTFLSDFINKEGRAGWGVWCILEDAQPPTSLQEPKQSTPEPPVSLPGAAAVETQRLTLKVYAWGEIASHTYLLLFLASERRIRRMGAQWRDGGDEVIIEMP